MCCVTAVGELLRVFLGNVSVFQLLRSTSKHGREREKEINQIHLRKQNVCIDVGIKQKYDGRKQYPLAGMSPASTILRGRGICFGNDVTRVRAKTHYLFPRISRCFCSGVNGRNHVALTLGQPVVPRISRVFCSPRVSRDFCSCGNG